MGVRPTLLSLYFGVWFQFFFLKQYVIGTRVGGHRGPASGPGTAPAGPEVLPTRHAPHLGRSVRHREEHGSLAGQTPPSSFVTALRAPRAFTAVSATPEQRAAPLLPPLAPRTRPGNLGDETTASEKGQKMTRAPRAPGPPGDAPAAAGPRSPGV